MQHFLESLGAAVLVVGLGLAIGLSALAAVTWANRQ